MVHILRGTSIVGKGPLSSYVTVQNLLRENIFLVQKEHDGSIGKGTIVAHTSEQLQCLHHTVRTFGLSQSLIILTKCSNEDDSSNLIEAINPLSTFRTLSSHIVHFKVNAVDTVTFHHNLCCSDTCDEYILGSWSVIRGGNARYVVKVFFVGVNDVDSGAFGPNLFHSVGLPQNANTFMMCQKLLGIIIRRQAGPRTLPHPILNPCTTASLHLRRSGSIVNQISH
mmetsp:Transcript_14575/g.23757  ORF Transcript_14575/g.23757 Transcript_14575/m.23757 type:complete len:225 (-) Transcript_14575:639-1313(-)